MERTHGIWGIPCNHVTYVMIQKASDIPPVYPSFDHCFSTNAYDVEFWGTYHLWSMHAYPNTPCFNMPTLRGLNITAMCQRHLHMYFHERKCLNFDLNFIEDIYTYGTPQGLKLTLIPRSDYLLQLSKSWSKSDRHGSYFLSLKADIWLDWVAKLCS